MCSSIFLHPRMSSAYQSSLVDQTCLAGAAGRAAAVARAAGAPRRVAAARAAAVVVAVAVAVAVADAAAVRAAAGAVVVAVARSACRARHAGGIRAALASSSPRMVVKICFATFRRSRSSLVTLSILVSLAFGALHALYLEYVVSASVFLEIVFADRIHAFVRAKVVLARDTIIDRYTNGRIRKWTKY